jgi:hypothetical protein
LPRPRYFIEPCAGDGALIRHLQDAGHFCADKGDIEPKAAWIPARDALTFDDWEPAEYFITNPPWDRGILHPLIVQLSDRMPTWLLFDADWMHTRQAAPYLPRLHKIVSVGRVKWIPGTTMTGMDNCCWYLFRKDAQVAQFVGRAA